MQNSGVKRQYGMSKELKDIQKGYSMEGKQEGGKKLGQRDRQSQIMENFAKVCLGVYTYWQAFHNIKVFGTVYLAYEVIINVC